MADMDHFLEWLNMSEGRWVRFPNMKLIGEAKLFWNNLELQLERVVEEPIVDCFEMKEKLKEKYLPLS